jgi:hypothetical protein
MAKKKPAKLPASLRVVPAAVEQDYTHRSEQESENKLKELIRKINGKSKEKAASEELPCEYDPELPPAA